MQWTKKIPKSTFYALVGLALLLSLLVLPQSFLEKTAYRFFRADKPILGTVFEVIGRGEKQFEGGLQWVAVSSLDPVLSGDQFITHGDSKILFQFNPPIWLMPYSKMEFFAPKEGSDLVQARLLYGQVRTLDANTENPAVEIFYENQKISDEEFSSTEEIIETELVNLDSAQFKDLERGTGTPEGQLEKQIFETLLLHKKFFQGCLIKWYKKESGKVRGGETVFDLKIQVNGAIEDSKILSSEITDKEYQHCLQQVLARVRFKNLQITEPLKAKFPLNVTM